MRQNVFTQNKAIEGNFDYILRLINISKNGLVLINEMWFIFLLILFLFICFSKDWQFSNDN